MVCPGRSIESIRKKPQTIQAGPKAVWLAAAGLLSFQDLSLPHPSYLRDPGRVTANFYRPMVIAPRRCEGKKGTNTAGCRRGGHWAESTSDSASPKAKAQEKE